jgi:aryl sulfotransferase
MNVIAPAWPVKRGESPSPVIDSGLWNDFEFRDDDIVIATYPKTGTTLTQQIVSQLIFDGDPGIYGMALSPWIDFRITPDAPARARAQTHRRFLKTHLALEHLVYSPRAKYIQVGRDAHDIIWSAHNHFRNLLPASAELGLPPPPPVSPDIRQFYRDFLDGAAQAYPMWSHIRGWWDARALPNMLVLHFNDLVADTAGQFRRIADFLDIEIDEARLPDMVAHCSLAHMRKVAEHDDFMNTHFRGGARTFLNEGVNGRWREVLSRAEIDRCDEIAAGELTPDCAAWLRSGKL